MDQEILFSRFTRALSDHEEAINTGRKENAATLQRTKQEMLDLYALALIDIPIHQRRSDVHDRIMAIAPFLTQNRFLQKRIETLIHSLKEAVEKRKAELLKTREKTEKVNKTGFFNFDGAKFTRPIAIGNLGYSIVDHNSASRDQIRKKLFESYSIHGQNMLGAHDFTRQLELQLTYESRKDVGHVLLARIPARGDIDEIESVRAVESLLDAIDTLTKDTHNESLAVILYGEISPEVFDQLASTHNRLLGAIIDSSVFRRDFGAILANAGLVNSRNGDVVTRTAQTDFNEGLFNIELGNLLEPDKEIDWREVLKIANKFRNLNGSTPLTEDSLQFKNICKTIERNAKLGHEYVYVEKPLLFL